MQNTILVVFVLFCFVVNIHIYLRQVPPGAAIKMTKVHATIATTTKATTQLDFSRMASEAHFVRIKICNSCNFHGKFATQKKENTQHPGTHTHICGMCVLIVGKAINMSV